MRGIWAPELRLKGRVSGLMSEWHREPQMLPIPPACLENGLSPERNIPRTQYSRDPSRENDR